MTCPNCGSEKEPAGIQTLWCPDCGTEANLDDTAEFKTPEPQSNLDERIQQAKQPQITNWYARKSTGVQASVSEQLRQNAEAATKIPPGCAVWLKPGAKGVNLGNGTYSFPADQLEQSPIIGTKAFADFFGEPVAPSIPGIAQLDSEQALEQTIRELVGPLDPEVESALDGIFNAVKDHCDNGPTLGNVLRSMLAKEPREQIPASYTAAELGLPEFTDIAYDIARMGYLVTVTIEDQIATEFVPKTEFLELPDKNAFRHFVNGVVFRMVNEFPS